MALSSLTGLSRSTLGEQTLSVLHRAITRGEMAPGERLGEVDLATRLGVGRGTVREALRSLQQRGLVTADDRGQHRVSELQPMEVQELFRVRTALEGLAVTEIMSAADRLAKAATLRASLPPEDGAGVSFLDMLEADLAFHETMCRLSGNSILVDLWLHLRDRMCVVILSGKTGPTPSIMERRHHSPIVDAIEAGDRHSAVAVVAAHMSASSTAWTT